MRTLKILPAGLVVAMILSGCGVHKVVTVPAKGVYETTKFAGKTVVGATKLTGKAAVGTTKVVGKGLWATGKGVYYIGSVPVKITDAALDTSVKVLTITTQMVDLSGKVVQVSRNISAMQLDAELAKVKTATNILSVVVDVAK